jgi:membrane-associated phospholipid phosphatase
MNEHLLDAINGFAGHSHLLDQLAKLAANDGIFLMGLVVAVLGVIQLRADFRRGILVGVAAIASVAVALGLAFIGSHLIGESRPFVVDHDTVRLIAHSADNAFPSDHATVAAAAAGVAALAWHRAAIIALGLAFAIGLSRIFVGVHYPGDVVAGWAAGIAAAGVCWFAVAKVGSRFGLDLSGSNGVSSATVNG